MSCKSSALLIWGQLLFAIGNPLFSDTLFVTNTDGDTSPGSLSAALYAAVDGDIIDCSPIAGQIIYVGHQTPTIGQNLSSPTSSLTILGSGVIIDGESSIELFSLAAGSVTMSGFTLQNGLSEGGSGGFGVTGGGGGTGGGGALYIHSGATLTISATSLNNNQAIGGNGGDGTTGGAGGGGGGYGGGDGGFASTTGSTAGAGAGGGGNRGGAAGGRDGANGSSNTFSNSAGAGGGGARPTPPSGARNGGTVAATASSPAYNSGAFGPSTANYGGGGGGGAGGGGGGGDGSDASMSEGGDGGGGGAGIGSDNNYGGGGGGGGGNDGGAGIGTGGGGGGLRASGGGGGVLGGGGGAGSSSGGSGGFGAGGGAGSTGGTDMYSLGGAGGSGSPAGGGGGSGLGGAIFIQKGALLIIEDGVSFSSNTTTAGTGGAATFAGSNGSSLGADLFIRSGGSITFQVNGALTLANPIEGGGSLGDVTGPGATMSGAGTVYLNGANTYLGETLIQSGTLNLNGSVIGDVNIASNGAFSGNATTGGNIYNSGTISPGNSIGEMFTTDLYLYSTSVYNVEVNSSGASDEIIASGLAQVGGGIVVTPDDFNFTTPLTYTIISGGSGVTGTFSSLTSTSASLMRLIYHSLTVQLTYRSLENVLAGNALNASRAFSTVSAIPGSDAAMVNNALFALSLDDLQTAFDQMGPAQFSVPTEIQLLDAILVRSSYTKHLTKVCRNKDSCCGQSVGFWIDGFGGWQDQKKGPFGYRDTTVGGTIGVDCYTRDFTLGFAFSSTYDHAHLKNFAGKAFLNSYYGGFYGRWNPDKFYIQASFLDALNHYRTVRRIHFGAIDRQAYSQHSGNELLVNFGFGYQMCPKRIQWTPYIHLDYVQQHETGYTETGADSLDLCVKAKNATLFQGEAGILLSATYSAWNGAFVPMLTLAYINQTPLSGKNYRANFLSSASVFAGRGGDYERNLFAPRFSLAYQSSCDRVRVSIDYEGEIGSRYWAQNAGFDVSLRF